MNCPACGREMTEVEVQGVMVDVCRGGCGGIWFDRFELKKVDEAHEEAGSALLEVERDPAVSVDVNQRRDCPHCGDVIMMRHFASVKRDVEVDECPRCGGFFLDQGELNTIRTQFATEEERRAAASDLFDELFDADLEQLEDESRDRQARARGLARMFRFLLPSYYIPGKQRWGAY